MPLSSHVTSLPLSLALREAGYKQKESFFVWRLMPVGDDGEAPTVLVPRDDNFTRNICSATVAAPLASELMDVLPDGYFPVRVKNVWNTGLLADFENIEGWGSEGMHAGTLCDALAKLWLHIHSQKII